MSRNIVTLLDVRRRLAEVLSSPALSGVEELRSLTPHIGAGWEDDDADAGFYVDRARVYFTGVLRYAGGGNAATPITDMPPDARPIFEGARLTLFTNGGSTSAATQGKFWSGFLDTGGDLDLQGNPAFAGAPNFGMPPVDTTLDLENVSFRIR